ncbi:MAG: DNA-binding protein WhiA [Coprococcus sp.]|nr:DNA-binding protein WhiA [Coprococcus sp.]
MSFSAEVKKELAKNMSGARHCQIAELAAMISMVADIQYKDNIPVRLKIATERSVIARNISGLIRKLFHYLPEVSVRRTGSNSRLYRMMVTDAAMVQKMLDTLKLIGQDDIGMGVSEVSCQDMKISGLITQQDCCRRAFLKGAFMTSGSISDPNKGYHLEIVCNNDIRALFIKKLIREFDIEGRIVRRKRYRVVYVKDGAMIVDMLNIMGAHISLMNMENVRILKDISNNINRRVNCEAANLNKTVSAAVKQIQDINYIIETKGIKYLPENLRSLAEVRLEAEDASLKELGEMMNPPLGKSGVNHRLRKISEIADELRGL